MKIALIGEIGDERELTFALNNNRPDGKWVVNSVEALMWALDGEVWHGQSIGEMHIAQFSTYDVVIINLNDVLWEVAIELREKLPQAVKIYGYQEGPWNWADTMDLWDLQSYLKAIRTVDCVLLYEPKAVKYFQRLGAKRVEYLPIPAPVEIYEQYRKPLTARPEPKRIMIGPAFETHRGFIASIDRVAERYRDKAILVAHAASIPGAGVAAKLIAERGFIPDVLPTLAWINHPWGGDGKPICGRHRYRRSPSYLERLADCVQAVNMELRPCYGRLAVDCKALGVTYVGNGRTTAEHFRHLITVDEVKTRFNEIINA